MSEELTSVDPELVEVERHGTVQLREYHPVSVTVRVRKVIKPGESITAAVDRVDGEVETCFWERYSKLMEAADELRSLRRK